MTAALWEVKYTYSLSYGGSDINAVVYVAADDITGATSAAVSFLDQLDRFSKRINSVKELSFNFFQKLS